MYILLSAFWVDRVHSQEMWPRLAVAQGGWSPGGPSIWRCGSPTLDSGKALMNGQVAWLARVLAARNFPIDRLARGLDIGADVALGRIARLQRHDWAQLSDEFPYGGKS